MTTIESLPPSLVANLAAISAFQQQQQQKHHQSNLTQQQQFYHQQLQQQLQQQQLLQQSQLSSAQNLSNALRDQTLASLPREIARKESLESPKHATPVPSRSPSVATCSTPTPVTSGTDLPLDLSAKPCSEDTGSCTSRSSSPTIEQRLQALAGARHPLSLGKLGLVDTATLLQDSHLGYKAKPPMMHHSSRSNAVAGRRTYTEEGLQAALRAIQDGKLGTRRAAVLYGIPRSTLRNKVYKLALERGRDSNLLPRSPSVVSNVPVDDKELLDDDDEDRDSADEAEAKSLNYKDDLIRLSQDPSNPDSLRLLLECGSKQVRSGDDDSPSPPSYPPAYPPELWPGMDPATYLTQIISASVSGNLNLNALGAAAFLNPLLNPLLGAPRRTSPEDKLPSEQPPPDFLPKLQPLPDILRKIMTEDQQHQQQLKKERERERERPLPFNGSGPSTSVISSDSKNSRDSLGSNFILNVPSFRPKNGDESSQRSPTRSESSSPTGSVGKMGIHLRDVIAKSINQKFNQPSEPPQYMNEHFKRAPFTPPIRDRDINHPDDRRLFSPGGKSPIIGHIPGSSSPANHGGVGGKGTRPKRGKYRNYNRDALVEAVRAVQRGEMSVHRAGSHYGVPHSTLEYKVKERHLMRPRKREPKPQNNDDLKRKEEGLLRLQPPLTDKSKLSPLKQTPKHVAGMLPGTPNGLKMPPMFDPSLRFPGAPPFPFWAPNPFHHPMPLDFPRGPNFTQTPEQFFASQMMQRIHEETAAANSAESSGTSPVMSALGKNAREVAESLYDGSPNGSFLDGIIRSSLETGLNAKQREEQSSNKTLLEQLCRNSRLSNPHRTDQSSSEDEMSHSNVRTESPHSRHEESDCDVKPTSDEISACDKVDNGVENKKEIEESELRCKEEKVDIKMETD
ncbi:hypothetical protein WDU94_002232 [Cyamophila willieti]